MKYYAMAAIAVFFGAVNAVAEEPAASDLTQASLEELTNIHVTSVSKKEQNLLKAAASVFVITQEEIRRSGASNLPDLLRMAPGVDVAQIDANTWAISVRGFNDRLANKVLVLIDGRTVYTPTTAGVYWDQLDVPLENIERIEVIRGAGGTVWGANAVNGVINIITLNAAATPGLLLRTGIGTQNAVGGLLQYGGKAGKNGEYRIFENYLNAGNETTSDGTGRAFDGWHKFHSGFRADWNLSDRDRFTLQGDLMQAGEGQTVTLVKAAPPIGTYTFNDSITVGEGNILGRWQHQLKDGSETSLQIYYDRYHRNDLGVDETLRTLDFDFQHHITRRRNDIVWGLGYRSTRDAHKTGYSKVYTPLDQANHLFSTFLQDQIALSRSVSLIVGSKFERQPYTGFHIEPSAQLIWTPTVHRAVWVSASRAVREPSREERGLQVSIFTFRLPTGGLGVAQFNGNAGTTNERVNDFEAGYREQLNKRLSIDLAAFSSYYRNLDTADPGEPYFTLSPAPPHLVLPSNYGNTADAHTNGIELSATWLVTGRWSLTPGYSYLQENLQLHPGSRDTTQQRLAGDTSHGHFQLRSFVNLTRHVEWDSAAFFVSGLPQADRGPVPAYLRVDTRLGWKVGEYLEFSLTGQNLLSPRHAEFPIANEVQHTLIERSVFAKITWRY